LVVTQEQHDRHECRGVSEGDREGDRVLNV
jgi:hypothetical protein